MWPGLSGDAYLTVNVQCPEAELATKLPCVASEAESWLVPCSSELRRYETAKSAAATAIATERRRANRAVAGEALRADESPLGEERAGRSSVITPYLTNIFLQQDGVCEKYDALLTCGLSRLRALCSAEAAWLVHRSLSGRFRESILSDLPQVKAHLGSEPDKCRAVKDPTSYRLPVNPILQ